MDISSVVVNIPISNIKIFLSFVESKSLNECAINNKLQNNQLKRNLQQLEKHFKRNLIEKTRDQYVSSVQAQSLYRPVKEFIDSLSNILEQKQDLKVYFPILISHIFLKYILNKIDNPQIEVNTYSHSLFKSYGLLVKEKLNDFDLIYINTEFERLLDPNIWKNKFKLTVTEKLYATKNYIDKSSPINLPEDLQTHDCIAFSNESDNEWTFSQDGKTKITVQIDPNIIIDNTFMQVPAIANDLGICKIQPLILDYMIKEHNISGNFVEVLPEYTLNAQEWALYAKSDCNHVNLNSVVNELKEITYKLNKAK